MVAYGEQLRVRPALWNLHAIPRNDGPPLHQEPAILHRCEEPVIQRLVVFQLFRHSDRSDVHDVPFPADALLDPLAHEPQPARNQLQLFQSNIC